MTISLYDFSVPVFQHQLHNLIAILDKSEVFSKEKKISEEVLLNARLAPDMFHCIRQVQIATDHAKGATARLAGVEIPKYEDTEKNLDELRARIQKTLDFMATLNRSQFENAEAREIVMTFPWATYNFTGIDYLNKWALPNFYFHMTTAYNIFRHQGVNVGKNDFLGNMQ
jgi:hypothetical protein